jgi:hypothetical protein
MRGDLWYLVFVICFLFLSLRLLKKAYDFVDCSKSVRFLSLPSDSKYNRGYLLRR